MSNAGEKECSATPCKHWYPKEMQNSREPVCNVKGNCYRLREYGGILEYSLSSCKGKICRYSGLFCSPKDTYHNRLII